jgi:hypothetical protein
LYHPFNQGDLKMSKMKMTKTHQISIQKGEEGQLVIAGSGFEVNSLSYGYELTDSPSFELAIVIQYTYRQDRSVAWSVVLTEIDSVSTHLGGLCKEIHLIDRLADALGQLSSHWIDPITVNHVLSA